MAVQRLGAQLAFPPPSEAEPSGLLAIGGDLEPERLLLAYSRGIFPWYEDGLPILWHSPDPRMVLLERDLHVPRRLGRVLRAGRFHVSLDAAFERVIHCCAEVPRPDQPGTWITGDMIGAYVRLHEMGYAHSVEAWRGGDLVGGIYGVSLGACFFGESMFTLASDASKVAFVTLVRQLGRFGIDLVDCQVHTEHMARFGATEWPRSRFLPALAKRIGKPTRRGTWRLDADLTARKETP